MEVSFVDWTTIVYIWLAVPVRSLDLCAISWFLYDCHIGAHKRMTRMCARRAHLLLQNIEAFKDNDDLVTRRECDRTHFTIVCGVGERLNRCSRGRNECQPKSFVVRHPWLWSITCACTA